MIAVSVPSWHAAVSVALVMTMTTLIGARVAPSVWWTAITAPLGFLLVGALTIAFQVKGWHIGLAPHGLELAGRLAARALAGVTCLLFLALTTAATDLVGGLRRLGIPPEITEMALLVYRFLFLLTGTAETMNAAQAARLGHSSYRRHMKSLSLLIANLMPRALARAQALEIGLGARGWHGDLRVLSPVRRASPTTLAVILAFEAAVLLIGLRTG